MAIIGILASVALPAVRDYMVREKVRGGREPRESGPGRARHRVLQGRAGGSGQPVARPRTGTRLLRGVHARDVVAAGRDSTAGTVTVTLRSIGGVIDDGRRIVYTGACGAGGMQWTVTGDVPPKYLPEN